MTETYAQNLILQNLRKNLEYITLYLAPSKEQKMSPWYFSGLFLQW